MVIVDSINRISQYDRITHAIDNTVFHLINIYVKTNPIATKRIRLLSEVILLTQEEKINTDYKDI